MNWILSIDDEPDAMQYWRNALRREGFGVYAARTTTEARRFFYLPGFSLIILDRMMPRGEIFGGDEHTLELDTGAAILGHIRATEGLRRIPVIVFTNWYDPRAARQWEENDDRLLVLPKALKPSELVLRVRECLARWKFESDVQSIPPDEYPDVVPYCIRDAVTNQKKRVFFDRCDSRDCDLLERCGGREGWILGDALEHYLSMPELRRNLLKVFLDDGESEEVLGLYYESEVERPDWWRGVYFESAPRCRSTKVDRKLKDVGKVLVARYLRQKLYTDQLYEGFVYTGEISGEQGIVLASSAGGRGFLERVGFRPAEAGSLVYRIDPAAARELLADVTCPKVSRLG